MGDVTIATGILCALFISPFVGLVFGAIGEGIGNLCAKSDIKKSYKFALEHNMFEKDIKGAGAIPISPKQDNKGDGSSNEAAATTVTYA